MDAKLDGAVETTDDLIRYRLDFAQRCFSNVQELNRFMDQKAGYLLSAVSLLTLALGIVASRSLDTANTSDLHVLVHSLALGFFVLYIVLAFLVVYTATRIFHALPSLLRQEPKAPGLMFPLILLGRVHDDIRAEEEVYYERLTQVSIDGIMRDYSNQIVEISAIYQRKQRHINHSTTLFGLLTGSWVITMLLLTATLLIQ